MRINNQTIITSYIPNTTGAYFTVRVVRESGAVTVYVNDSDVGSHASSLNGSIAAGDLTIGDNPSSASWEHDGKLDLVYLLTEAVHP